MSLVPQKEFDGVLLIDKPTEHTSHDVVARVRHKLQQKRVGHAGTLDPMATGLLLVLVGKSTRLSQYLMSGDKEYEGEMTLGVVTNSQDAEGEVVETRPVPADLDRAKIETVMQTFRGDQYQTPPMFSAIKVDGVPLYKMARKGEEIDREPRFIRIMAIEVLGVELPKVRFRVRCSKGTYVRTIAHDVGQKLGCGAHLSALRRTASGELRVEKAIKLEDFLALPPAELAKQLLAPHQVAPTHAL
ncbi:MAG: tRNA pseudouridine(55) synthase TruB [Opitutaceae bacterium]